MAYRRKLTIGDHADRKLDARRQYLLDRIPREYDVQNTEPLPVPPEVARARKIVARFDNKQAKHNCRRKALLTQLRIKAREAVYFCSEQTALNIIRRLEQFKARCDD